MWICRFANRIDRDRDRPTYLPQRNTDFVVFAFMVALWAFSLAGQLLFQTLSLAFPLVVPIAKGHADSRRQIVVIQPILIKRKKSWNHNLWPELAYYSPPRTTIWLIVACPMVKGIICLVADGFWFNWNEKCMDEKKSKWNGKRVLSKYILSDWLWWD